MIYDMQMDDISVGYGTHKVLEHVSLQIPQGTILAVIGPNGTGKSTLLKSLAKQLALLEGTIFIGKDDLQQLSYQQLSRKMSVVFTGRVRPELLQCYDVVAAGRYPYTGYFGLLGEEDKACIFEAMEQMQVTEFATRDFQTLSDGQKQRVLIARALCQQPEILVLDEPTSYLDIRYKLELMDLLRSLATEQNMTILLSIHEIDLAKKVADKVLCIGEDGSLGFGSSREMFCRSVLQPLFSLDDAMYDSYFGGMMEEEK